MIRRPLFIVAAGGVELAPEADFTPVALKVLMQETLGHQVRRVGRFIQLAMIGAATCVQNRELPSETSIVLCSGASDMQVTIEVLEQIFRACAVPKPLSFINTVSNAACFYLCKHFGLSGASTFVARRDLSFPVALASALNAANASGVRGFLVGGVDVLSQPESLHRLRIGGKENDCIAETSQWFLLTAEPQAGALGALLDVRFFANGRDACDWLRPLPPVKARYLLVDRNLQTDEVGALLKSGNAVLYEPKKRPISRTETAVAFLYRDFLERPEHLGATLIHAAKDGFGNIGLTLFEKR